MIRVILMQPIIYIDVLFLLNFFINSIIIYATAKVAKRNVGLIFLSIGATVSALYSVAMFFVPFTALTQTLLGRLIFSLLLVMLTFRVVKWQKLLKLTAIFYMTSFAFGGVVFGILYLTRASTALGMVISNGEIYLNVPIGILLLGIGTAYAGVIIYTKFVQRKFENDRVIVDVKIEINGNEVMTKALIDTGSELIEPLSKRPVIVVEYDILQNLLPADSAKLCNDNFNAEEFVEIVENNLHSYKFCLIPFSALGNSNGLMLGIIPDKLEFPGREQPEILPVIGICKDKLSPNGEFFALTHASLAY